MPSVGIHEDLLSTHNTSSAHGASAFEGAGTAIVAIDRQHTLHLPVGTNETELTVLLHGRQGHADCINGRYTQEDHQEHDGNPVSHSQLLGCKTCRTMLYLAVGA